MRDGSVECTHIWDASSSRDVFHVHVCFGIGRKARIERDQYVLRHAIGLRSRWWKAMRGAWELTTPTTIPWAEQYCQGSLVVACMKYASVYADFVI